MTQHYKSNAYNEAGQYIQCLEVIAGQVIVKLEFIKRSVLMREICNQLYISSKLTFIF